MNLFEKMKKINSLKKEYALIHKTHDELRKTEIDIVDEFYTRFLQHINSYRKDLRNIAHVFSVNDKIVEKKKNLEQKSELLNTLIKDKNYNTYVDLSLQIERLEQKKLSATKTVTEYQTRYDYKTTLIPVGEVIMTMSGMSTEREPIFKEVPDEEIIKLIQNNIDSLQRQQQIIPSYQKYSQYKNLGHEVRQLQGNIECLVEEKNDYNTYKNVLNDLVFNLKYYAFDEQAIKHEHTNLKEVLLKKEENYKKYLDTNKQLQDLNMTKFLAKFNRIDENRKLTAKTHLKFDVSDCRIKDAIYSKILILEQIDYEHLEKAKKELQEICHRLTEKNEQTQNAVKQNDKEFAE